MKNQVCFFLHFLSVGKLRFPKLRNSFYTEAQVLHILFGVRDIISIHDFSFLKFIENIIIYIIKEQSNNNIIQ